MLRGKTTQPKRSLRRIIFKSIVPQSYKALTGYLSKYLSSPPIAIRRITGYQDGSVSYYYKDHRTKKRKYVTVTVFTFMGRMLQQILPKGFQRIRYFGIQAKCVFNKWKEGWSCVLF